jgi:hypothetical protein
MNATAARITSGASPSSCSTRSTLPEEHASREHRFALPQPRQGFAFGRRCGQVGGAQREHGQAELRRRRRRRLQLADEVEAAQLRHRRRRSVARPRPQRCEVRRHRLVRRRQRPAVEQHRLDEALQAHVERMHAGQVMEHALVETQPAQAQRLVPLELDQAKATQRRRRHERAPVRPRQQHQRQRERRMRQPRLDGSAQAADVRGQLRRRAQKHQLALER